LVVARLLAADRSELAALIVVDNASTDGTAAFLADQDDPRLTVLRSDENLGGAGGFERGMRHMVETRDPDWIVVMDDDAYPVPGALAAFHGADLGPWDAVAAAVHFPDGTICDMNRPSRNPFARPETLLRTVMRVGGREGFHISPARYAASEPTEVDIASFVGLFVSRAAIARAGYPDGSLFVYGEDGLYTLALSQAGGRIGFLPQIRFEHDCSTFAAHPGRFAPLWKAYYYHRNLLMLYRAASGMAFPAVCLAILPKWVLKVRNHSGQRRAYLRLLWLAIRHGLARRTPLGHDEVLDRAGR
jgi:GT2 family glycosyltransferase